MNKQQLFNHPKQWLGQKDFLTQMYDGKFTPTEAQAKLDEIIASLILLCPTLDGYFDEHITFKILRISLSLTALGYDNENRSFMLCWNSLMADIMAMMKKKNSSSHG